MSTNKNSKPLGKGKKAGIIGGCAVVGGVLTDALLVALAPATGGLSTVALAAKKNNRNKYCSSSCWSRCCWSRWWRCYFNKNN